MKTFFLIFFFGLLSMLSFGQNLNQVVNDNQRNIDILLGELDINGIQGSIFGKYYHTEFDLYKPKKQIMASLKSSDASEFSYTIVLGSWCGDSKREVPRMLKVLSETGIENDAITLFGVDSKKEAAGTIVESLNIVKVPTLIVYHSDVEVGRIVETPVTSIERDLLKIIK